MTDHDCNNCVRDGICSRHPSIHKEGRLLQLCKGDGVEARLREKYLKLWDANEAGETIEVPKRNRKRRGKSKKVLLGDSIEKALSIVGITSERVSKVLGKPCGCERRKNLLNKVHLWSREILSGKTDKAASDLTEILGDKDESIPCEITWSYGVTTVPQRLGKEFDRTIESLKNAGFETPIIFVDGPHVKGKSDYSRFGLPVVHRESNLKTNAHWYLTALELYVREPNADRYAIFQDDFVAYRNLRQYIEVVEYPDKGYLNLYTFPQNQKVADRRLEGETGWTKSNQKGKGAVALVFDNDAMRTLLSQSVLVNRFQGRYRHKKVDGVIIDAMQKSGWSEYIHSPTLVQHIGRVSSMKNARSPDAIRFRGEEYDAMLMLNEEKKDKKPQG